MLVAAEETLLTVINFLEVPHMGDCDFADLKAGYERRLVLKGDLSRPVGIEGCG